MRCDEIWIARKPLSLSPMFAVLAVSSVLPLSVWRCLGFSSEIMDVYHCPSVMACCSRILLQSNVCVL